MENQNYLGTEKVGKLLFKFSIPCILSLLIGALYNIVDQIFIGNSSVGFLGNTATTVVYPITVIALAIALLFGDGTAAQLSLSQGRRRTASNHISVGNMLLCVFVLSLVLILVLACGMDGILYAFGATDNSFGLAKEYCQIIMVGLPFFMISTGLGSVIRSDGNPRFAMIAMLVGAIVNIVLDPILIFAFNMGIKGAAYATICGQIISFVLTFVYLFRAKTFKISISSFIPNFKIIFEEFKLGISSFLTQISIVIMSIVTNIMLKQYGLESVYGGDIPVAVYGIVMKIYQIVISIIVGISAGGQPIVGYNFGAGNYGKVRHTFKLILILSAAISFIFFILFEAIPGPIIRIFGSSSDLYEEFGRKMLRIYLLLIVATCVMKASAIFLQSLGKPTKSIILSLGRDIVMLVPLTLLLPLGMGIDGVLWAAPISDIVGIILTATLVFIEMKHLKHLELNATIKLEEKPQ